MRTRLLWLFLGAVAAAVVVPAVPRLAAGSALWIAAFVAPALIVLTIHALVIGTWRRTDGRRVRRRAEAALLRGDADSLRKAVAETEQARRDWPGIDLWAVSGALEITRRRIESSGRQPDSA